MNGLGILMSSQGDSELGIRPIKPKVLAVGWPGVCGVASQVIQKLDQGFGAKTIECDDVESPFEVEEVIVRDGIIFPGRVPSMKFRSALLGGSHGLLLFQPERQPEVGGLALCRSVLKTAMAQGVEKVVTFAAQPSTIDPRLIPRVRYCTTSTEVSKEMSGMGFQPLAEGKVKGLNGLMLLAAQQVGLPATCLIGEVPTVGLQMLNPKTTKILLETFLGISGMKLDLSHMDSIIQVHQDYMVELASPSEENAGFSKGDFKTGSGAEFAPTPVSLDALAAVEALFHEADNDRANALFLKSELDRLGLYSEYEDRFLDLFRECS